MERGGDSEPEDAVSEDQGADEEIKKGQALAYLIEIMSLVLRGLVMTEAYTAYTILGKGLSYKILEKTGKEAARYMLSGFPPLISGWNERFNLSNTEGRAEKAAVLYSTVMKLDGEVGDGWFEVANCPWKNMIDETLKDPLNYGVTRLSKPEEAEAIKCGCVSCDSCLKELIGSNGVHAEQVSCKADGEAKCRWVFK